MDFRQYSPSRLPTLSVSFVFRAPAQRGGPGVEWSDMTTAQCIFRPAVALLHYCIIVLPYCYIELDVRPPVRVQTLRAGPPWSV